MSVINSCVILQIVEVWRVQVKTVLFCSYFLCERGVVYILCGSITLGKWSLGRPEGYELMTLTLDLSQTAS
jgi:hypothetical protein